MSDAINADASSPAIRDFEAMRALVADVTGLSSIEVEHGKGFTRMPDHYGNFALDCYEDKRGVGWNVFIRRDDGVFTLHLYYVKPANLEMCPVRGAPYIGRRLHSIGSVDAPADVLVKYRRLYDALILLA